MADSADHAGPRVQLCREEDVAATSRIVGLAVVREEDPDGVHDPRCGGCHGQETNETCRFSVKQRRAAEEFDRRFAVDGGEQG